MPHCRIALWRQVIAYRISRDSYRHILPAVPLHDAFCHIYPHCHALAVLEKTAKIISQHLVIPPFSRAGEAILWAAWIGALSAYTSHPWSG